MSLATPASKSKAAVKPEMKTAATPEPKAAAKPKLTIAELRAKCDAFYATHEDPLDNNRKDHHEAIHLANTKKKKEQAQRVPCKFWAQNSCKYGNKCFYLHADRQPLPQNDADGASSDSDNEEDETSPGSTHQLADHQPLVDFIQNPDELP